jgi:beta-1,2-mannobiose phosphorylase / 1,2-beta-oligomannan phosphorylase
MEVSEKGIDMLPRLFTRRLLGPKDLPPSAEHLEILSVFNPGVAKMNGQAIILVRVAERPRERRKGYTALPYWHASDGVAIHWVADDELIPIDPRVVEYKSTGTRRLTFVSHLRAFRSPNGRTIETTEVGSRFLPETEYEIYGVEDPRITLIGDTFYFTYVAVSPHGACTALASTRDFQTYYRHGIIFPPENKDVLLFPGRITGDYLALHRPNPSTHFATPEMWIARSPDLINWGHHKQFLGGSSGWEVGRIGGGTPPVLFDGGWLEIYHGNNQDPIRPGVGIYSAGAILMDLTDPTRIVAHTNGPIMAPEVDFEKEGFLAEIVFPTGIIERQDTLLVYYGAADTYTGVTEFAKDALKAALKP